MDLSMCGDPADFLDKYRSGALAINVKVYAQFNLSKETTEQLSKLDKRVQNKVLQFAEDGVRENWWATMNQRSMELGLGRVYTEGRSGGWLVFEMTQSQLEEHIEDAEKQCLHCSTHYQQHIDGKCPFEASNYESEEKRALELWKSFRLFSAEVKESLKYVVNDLDSEVLFQLENLDADDAAVLTTGGSPGARETPEYSGEESDEGA